MFYKKAIHCVKCSYVGKALILRSTLMESMAVFVLIGLCIVLPQLLVYTIPLILVDLFLPAIQFCPECKHVEFLPKSEDQEAATCKID